MGGDNPSAKYILCFGIKGVILDPFELPQTIRMYNNMFISTADRAHFLRRTAEVLGIPPDKIKFNYEVNVGMVLDLHE